MKIKIISVLSILIAGCVPLSAQPGYIGIDMGYGTGIPAYSLGTSTKTSLGGTTYTLEKGNYGQGLSFGFKGGYMFSKNVGMELRMSYLIGSKKEFISSYVNVDSSLATITQGDGTITLDKIKMVRMNPAVKLTLGESARPYFLMGLILGFGTSYSRIEQTTITTTGSINDTTTIETAREYSGGTAFGFNGAFGVDIDLTDNFVLFGELNFSSISWAAKKSKLTRYMVDGVDQMPLINVSSLETEYVDDYTVPLTGNSGNSKELKTYLPFGSFGITAGVIYVFGSE